MNNLNSNRKQRGVGLIEILIVLVVLVIGWAAIAALQGKLMSGTSVSKARNEALELAREKTEELRNSVEKGQYTADVLTGGPYNDAANPITGVNANFNRSWTIVNVDVDNPANGAEDYIKEVTVSVSWTNNEAGSESVTLNNMIGYSDAIKMASLATGGSEGGGGTSPNVLTATEGPSGPGITITDSGETPESGDLLIDSDTTIVDISTGVDSNGNLVVYQGAATGANVELTVYGGKILKFTGMVYYNSSPPFVRATSPSYCATFKMSKLACGFPITSSGVECAKYVCYAGGDCSNGGDDCPMDTSTIPNLNGGWYGKIGDFFPSLSNPLQFPTICMGDSIDVAARYFGTERVFTGSTTGFENEGINTSFACNDTLISAPNDTGCTSLISKLAGYGIAVNPNANPNEIADHRNVRSIAAGATNTVLAASDNSYYNGVFDNFCGAGNGGSSSSSSSSSGASSSSGSSSSSGASSSSGGPTYTHSCSCFYRNSAQGVITVTGVRNSDSNPETGCCSLSGCTANQPNPISNNSTFTYQCN